MIIDSAEGDGVAGATPGSVRGAVYLTYPDSGTPADLGVLRIDGVVIILALN
jgi:hypothetical protein